MNLPEAHAWGAHFAIVIAAVLQPALAAQRFRAACSVPRRDPSPKTAGGQANSTAPAWLDLILAAGGLTCLVSN